MFRLARLISWLAAPFRPRRTALPCAATPRPAPRLPPDTTGWLPVRPWRHHVTGLLAAPPEIHFREPRGNLLLGLATAEARFPAMLGPTGVVRAFLREYESATGAAGRDLEIVDPRSAVVLRNAVLGNVGVRAEHDGITVLCDVVVVATALHY